MEEKSLPNFEEMVNRCIADVKCIKDKTKKVSSFERIKDSIKSLKGIVDEETFTSLMARIEAELEVYDCDITVDWLKVKENREKGNPIFGEENAQNREENMYPVFAERAKHILQSGKLKTYDVLEWAIRALDTMYSEDESLSSNPQFRIISSAITTLRLINTNNLGLPLSVRHNIDLGHFGLDGKELIIPETQYGHHLVEEDQIKEMVKCIDDYSAYIDQMKENDDALEGAEQSEEIETSEEPEA